MKRKIYMDHAATSFPKAPGVSDAMKRYLDEIGCNIGRGSYEKSTEAGLAVYEVREKTAKAFGCSDPKRVIFTSGATAALNMAIGGYPQTEGSVLISSLEHNAVMRPLTGLGRKVIRIPSDQDGSMRLDTDKIRWDSVRMCVVTHASNVCGTIQPVEELARVCAEHNVPVILDAAQTAGIRPIDLERSDFSAVCVPAHKGLKGPQGLGVMILSEAFAHTLKPVLFGGTGSVSYCDRMPEFLPDRFESGTLNLPGIFGLGAAMESFDQVKEREREEKLTARFLKNLKSIEGIRVPGPREAEKRVAVVSVDFLNQDNSIAADKLEQEYGIMTRCGLHCAPEAHKTIGTFPQGTVRFSFSSETTPEEIDYCSDAVQSIAKENAGRLS
jgi:cysteine desulfurase family protein